ncbi:MAG: hypothetical protein LBP54_02220 [Campylobacteraceae bacterium]|jgi:hypothetical protein|nr:hypothetical protein [Campylobacteraceae bacterium]
MENFKNQLKMLLLGDQHAVMERLKRDFANYETLKTDKSFAVLTGKRAKPFICVHLDTINDHRYGALQEKDIEEQDGLLFLSSESAAACLGGDDRCGLAIALNLIETEKYHFGFFLDEEIGRLGSHECHLSSVINRITCFIGLDRRNTVRGESEFASYGYDNHELAEKLTADWKNLESGSSTDCKTLAEKYDLACYNLSVGYRYEHTQKEYIYVPDAYYTCIKLKNLEWDEGVYPCQI